MRFVYVVTRGAGDPTGASVPIHLAANGSLEVGHDVSVLLAGDGTELVVGDTAQALAGLGVPPMKDLLAKLREGGATLYV
jgi:predicted peroxiredoxin